MSTVAQIPLDRLGGLDLLPLATLHMTMEKLGVSRGIEFTRDIDDLDDHDIAAMELVASAPARRLVFALRVYRGAPADSGIDVLLPAECRGNAELHELVDDIATTLALPRSRLVVHGAAAPAMTAQRRAS